MGCDIHNYVEIKTDHFWRLVKKPVQSDWNKFYFVDYYAYKDRNYDLFSQLANVRNGSGFSGCVTGEGFEPISAPKGMPDDCDDLITASSERWSTDGHSHSYLSLAELLAYKPSERRTVKAGLIAAPVYIEWQKRRLTDQDAFPESWCGGTSAKTISEAAWKALSQNERDTAKELYIECRWGATYERTTESFWKTYVPRLIELRDEYQLSDTDVRMVFWFDN